MLVIPAIDIIGGQCVRLTKGDYDTKKVYEADPLKMAKLYEEKGFTHLHLVDLDGAKAGEVKNWDVLKRIASGTSLKVDFSGGIKTLEAVQKAFDLGAAQVAIGSLAVKDPSTFESWLAEMEPEKFILAADVHDGFIATHGWQEKSMLGIDGYLSHWLGKGIKRVLCTDISKDGMLQGPAVSLYKGLIEKFPEMELIASGGVSSLDDLKELSAIGCHSVVVGKAIYEGRIGLDELPVKI